jgi:DNA-directed RNA polymerase subunit RPC12/RpoP
LFILVKVTRSQSSEADDVSTAWLALSVADDARVHGGNKGYIDEPSSVYRYDSTVPRAKEIAEGDRIVLWDKAKLLGASVIDQILMTEGEKPLYRCPKCQSASFKGRSTKTPEFRCHDCGHEFEAEEREVRTEPVAQYEARYAARWIDLDGSLSGSQLRELCVRPNSQHSFRPLHWQEFVGAVESANGPVLRLLGPAVGPSTPSPPGGHASKVVRVRIGQPQFRKSMLQKYGETCAFTGPCPPQALEAAHLYSYAAVGKHHDSGGLLLRRDLHSLFDSGLLTINPADSRIDVDPLLSCFPEYERLNGQPLSVKLSSKQLRWVRAHWDQFRTASVL